LLPVMRKECRIPDSLICCPNGAARAKAAVPVKIARSVFIGKV
jgi:hypothetical protein